MTRVGPYDAYDYGFGVYAPPSGDNGLPVDGAVLWLDALQETAFADSDPINVLTDFSGVGNDLLQGTAANMPTFHTGGGVPYITGDGVDDFMLLAATLFDSSDPGITVIQASKWSVRTSTDYCYSLSDSVAAGFGRLEYRTGDFMRSFYHDGSNTDSVATSTATTLIKAVRVERLDTNAGEFQLFTNNTLRDEDLATPLLSFDTDQFSLFAQKLAAASPTGYFGMDLHEFIVYPFALSAVQRQAVSDYLYAKWGITP